MLSFEDKTSQRFNKTGSKVLLSKSLKLKGHSEILPLLAISGPLVRSVFKWLKRFLCGPMLIFPLSEVTYKYFVFLTHDTLA